MYRLTINVNLMKCNWNICENEVKDGNKFCSVHCKNKFHVTNRRRKIKIMSVEYKGGKCYRCGYNKCVDALEFHHKDPTKKDFALSAGGITHSWETVKNELDKCDIVCSNCHREIHSEQKLAGIVGQTPT